MTTALRSDAYSTALAPSLLSIDERLTLSWVCGTLFPRLDAQSGEHPDLFGTDAIALGVPAAMEEALASTPPEQASDFRLLLRALDQPLFVLTLIGKPHAFRSLGAEDRERALLAMSVSPLPLARKGFQALKRLAAFLFYSVVDERGGNPTWAGIGYVPSSNPPGREAALRLTTITAPTMLDADVCIVGSGAGGGVVAAELAAAGLRVVVLEQGPGDQAPEYDQREIVGTQRLYLDRGTTSTRDLGVSILAGSCLGGGTAVNWQTSLPLPPGVRDEWAALSGLPFFSDVAFAASFDAVSRRAAVGVNESLINSNNDALRRGCAALGWHWSTIPRNAQGCDPGQCGYCVHGCRHGGKQTTAVTFLADAQQSGETVIVPNCHAVRLVHSQGKVSGVRAVARDARSAMGTEYKVDVHSTTVVVAAGAIGTPALLLRSGLSAAALGRNLYLHPTSAVAGRYPTPIRTWVGPPQTVLCDEHATMEGAYGARLEVAPAHPGLHALALPWFGAREHRRRMQRLDHVSTTIVLTRDRTGGRVRARRDGRAMIDYQAGTRELEHLRRGIAAAVRAHLAAGAEEVLTLHSRPHVLVAANASAKVVDDFCDALLAAPVDRNWSTLFSAHQMGTCRMGRDPRSTVCDEWGKVRGVQGAYVADASLFPASSGVNPMLTVMALAHHVAQGLIARR